MAGLTPQSECGRHHRGRTVPSCILSGQSDLQIPGHRRPGGPDGQQISMSKSGVILIYLAEKSGLFLPRHGCERVALMEWWTFQKVRYGPIPGQTNRFIPLNSKEDVSYGLKRFLAKIRSLHGVMDRRLS